MSISLTTDILEEYGLHIMYLLSCPNVLVLYQTVQQGSYLEKYMTCTVLKATLKPK